MAQRRNVPQFTDTTIVEMIAAQLEHGASFKTAVTAVGMSERTGLRYRARGRKEHSGPYRRFEVALRKAERAWQRR
jgi:hypothetical protein